MITRQIAALEEHLGIKLMVRTTRRLTLTAGGAAYLEATTSTSQNCPSFM
ncbi:MAG: LysR family transcriptional regulator [Chromatiaceae bacterium]|nr:LysR family transcriptional regulator [Chromatiaceae bacterium]MBP8290017.1 LysR family transcriptional regulator [Chromatiaceae bacterium]